MTAPSPDVTVGFSVTFDYRRYYSENELSASASTVLARIAGDSTIEGSIDITGLGMPTIRFIDEIAPWIQTLCFQGASALAVGVPVHIHYFSQSGEVDLEPKGDEIVVTGDLLAASATYQKAALLPELVRCGSRFLAFADTVKGSDENYMANIDYIRQFEESAHAAVDGN